MARTYQNVVDRARQPLKDAEKLRWPDAVLLGFANDGVLLLRQRRPDLFFGSYAALPGTEQGLNSPIPVGDEFLPPLADYVTARALVGDDEDSMQQQASSFFALWNG